ncbi:MAG: methyl-accepting chemotaxis protein, partial [Nitrospinota bacterium]
MNISFKIMSCQLILVAIILANGLYATLSSLSIRDNTKIIQTEVLKNEQLLSEIALINSSIQNHTKSYFLSNSADDKKMVESMYIKIDQTIKAFMERNSERESTLTKLGKLLAALDQFQKENLLLEKALVSIPSPVVRRVVLGQRFAGLTGIEHEIETLLSALSNEIATFSQTKLTSIEQSTGRQIKISFAVMVLSVFVSILLGFLLTKDIAPPLRQAMHMIEEMGKGHLDNRLNLVRKDEIGRMGRTFDTFADNLKNEVLESFERLAKGDFVFQASGLIRKPLARANAALNAVMANIRKSGDLIASEANLLSISSKSLSQGVGAQADSMEEITGSMTEIALKTKQSAESAQRANQFFTQTKDSAEKGKQQMVLLAAAMTNLSQSGQNISKIIKTIDEIAFQTNLPALNAAVEAARAGRHGKGFAVVAEDVRSLAGRRARAASDTSELIKESVQKTENGTSMAQQVSEALTEIVHGVTRVTDLVEGISMASMEQAQMIDTVNGSLSRIDQVTQQNKTTAKAGAASANELSDLAKGMRSMLGQFKLTLQGAS